MTDFKKKIEDSSTDMCVDGTCAQRVISETEIEIKNSITERLSEITKLLEDGWTQTVERVEESYEVMQECDDVCDEPEQPECSEEKREEYIHIKEQQRLLEIEIRKLEEQLEILEVERVRMISECPLIAEKDRQLVEAGILPPVGASI